MVCSAAMLQDVEVCGAARPTPMRLVHTYLNSFALPNVITGGVSTVMLHKPVYNRVRLVGILVLCWWLYSRECDKINRNMKCLLLCIFTLATVSGMLGFGSLVWTQLKVLNFAQLLLIGYLRLKRNIPTKFKVFRSIGSGDRVITDESVSEMVLNCGQVPKTALATGTRLRHDLFCAYDKLTRPVKNHTSTTEVEMSLLVQHIDYLANALIVLSSTAENGEIEVRISTESGKPLRKNYPSSPDRDSNLDLPVLSIRAQHDKRFHFPQHWHDQHLVWDESKYDSIDYMYVEGADLWHPDIVLFNTLHIIRRAEVPSREQRARRVSARQMVPTDCALWGGNTNNQIKPFLSTCFVNSVGSVMCVSRNFFESRCRAELTYWPFDTRNCTLKFSSWASTGEQVNLTNKGGIWVEKRKNREWKYVSAKTTANVKKYECCPNDTFPDVTLTFQLERHSSRHVAIIIMPAVVLAMITLCSFWMPAVALERITVCCMTFVSHVFFLLYLGYMLPGNTNQVPLIVLYYRDSMILTTLAVLATVLGRYWTLKKSHPPDLLSSAVNLLMRTGTGKLLLIRELGVKRPVRGIDADGEDCEGLIEGLPSLPSSRDSGWRLVVAFMDRAMFITYLALYLIFQTGLLP
uniref:Uncharacterized protein n=1 Tax=Timema cristinae TaxID=61476 RepID=A0A7R9D3X4_TIMCR|nr:unnamed protein product [Timema cristinae]